MTADVTELTELQITAHRTADVLVAKGGPMGVAEAERLFRSYATVYTTPSREHGVYDFNKANGAADAVIKHMLRIAAARQLVQDVRKLRRKRIRVIVEFRDTKDLPRNTSDVKESTSNFFTPTGPGEDRYSLFIVWTPDLTPTEIKTIRNNQYILGISEMADSVFHELLHVWYTNTYPGDHLGHGGGLNDAKFRDRMKLFKDELMALDTTLRPRPPLGPRP
jgi:hypothetical protein